jgi:putative ABC transport system ATP-binding protein
MEGKQTTNNQLAEVFMIILKATNLKKHYGGGSTVVKTFDGVDIAVGQGEFVSVVGSSGSGKSTLLHMLGGLARPTEGTVEIVGKAIVSMKDDELTIFRRRNIGFVFQSYNLIPVLNAEENILLPVELDGNKPDKAFVGEVMRTLGLPEKRTVMPNQLSGGQQQRVAIARALASKPSIILADEPTGNLDSKSGMDVMGLLKVCGEKYGQTIVMITHNPEIAQMANRIIHLEDGRIV